MLTAIFAENPHNFIRAESLKMVSLEMAALIAVAVLIWRYRSGGLVVAYALLLPFNDVVYRLGPVTPADVVGLLVLLRRPPRSLGMIAPIVPWVLWGLAVTTWTVATQPASGVLGSALFSYAYAMRFVIMLLVAASVPADRLEGERCVDALTTVTILAAGMTVLQVALWRLGLPIDGVFANGGFVRPKGLSHEPSTASVWFALSLPLLAVRAPSMTTKRRAALGIAIAVGLFLTASLSGFMIAGAVGLVIAARYARRMIVAREAVAISGVLIVVSGLIVGLQFGDQVGVLADNLTTYVSELANGPTPENIGDESGRGGDVNLLREYPPGWLGGVGIFGAPVLAEKFEDRTGAYAPASNIIVTSALETGLVGLALLLGGLLVVTLSAFRRFGRDLGAFAAGFVGFDVALLGQRILAFPQPWFMLAVARSLAGDGGFEQTKRHDDVAPDTAHAEGELI